MVSHHIFRAEIYEFVMNGIMIAIKKAIFQF